LFVRDWPLDACHAGGVVLMHGLGEHCGRYEHVARFFNARGWSVRSYDQRGHGRSDGARGDVPAGDTLIQDARAVIDDFAQALGRPPLLLGHSMGGLFAARVATTTGVHLRGLILSSPALAIPMTPVQKLMFKVLRNIAPGLGVSNGLQSRYLSHHPAVVRAYDADPLVHSRITARLLTGMLDAVDHVHAAPSLAIPTLMLVAGDDRLVDASGSAAFFARLHPGIGTMHHYPALYHETFNEIDAHRVFDDLHAWLNTLNTAPSESLRAAG
jgi:alpha-beta hydrolase superfamily lysophospholipase